LPRPRTVVRGGVAVIELCEELREAARAAGVITREYGRESARNHGVETKADSQNLRGTAEICESGTSNDSQTACLSCGKRFRARHGRQKYCSDVCRARAQRG
jgi:hypothetical protein